MTSALPKLRSDLDQRVQTNACGTALVIKDPSSGQFFRLQDAEQFIAGQLDGATSLELVQKRTEEKFGAALTPEALAAFVKTLDRNGLLETEKSQRAKRRSRRRRINGTLLYLRVRLLDPDRLLNALVRRARFFFTRQFLCLSVSVMLSAIAITIFNWEDIFRDASDLYRLSTLPLLVATIFFVITAHEFAHGLTCKHFGGEVREMGFLLLYFQPALYCNVSDAWLFPEKSKRLWVGFAGPYFEMFLWALATLAWRLTDTGTWVNSASLVVMATSGIKTLANFNPLIKLDGYYLLSDCLDLPNLRKKAFHYLGDCLRTVGGLTGPLREVSPRERRIYLTYGIIAWLFSISFLTYVALFVGEYLIVNDQRAAFFGFTGLISLRLRSRFTKLFSRKAQNGEAGSRSKRKWRFWRRLIWKLALLCALYVFLFYGRMDLRIAGPINVLPLHNADVRTRIEGLIEQVYVDEGQRVNKGDLIARISDREQRADLRKVEAAIQEVQARLGMLRAGPTKLQIEVARRAVTTAEDRLAFAKARLTRDEPLFSQGLLAPSEFDDTRELVARAKNGVAESLSQLDLLLDGTRPEEIDAAQAQLARLEAERRYGNEQLQFIEVLSPAAGIVTTPSRQLRELIGQMIRKGEVVAKVHELNTVTVEAAISEKEIADIQVGQTVAIKVRAHPERAFYGKVTAIAMTVQGAASIGRTASSPNPAPTGNPAPNAILITTEIDNSAGLLKPGMSGMAKIYCGEQRMIDLVIRRLSRTFRVEFWSWW